MPDFFLEPGCAERHAEFDALPDIARGYIEAALFTGLAYVFPDPGGDTLLCDGTRGRCEEIDGLGLGNLDAESFRDMASDAARFWIENTDALERATASGGYDLEQAGRDFWFSRNGHGVGFFDRGLGEAGDSLQAVAEHAGECDLFAEPLEGIDPDAPDGWTVGRDSPVAPLTDAERAALAALEGERWRSHCGP